jgi:hypothetical protein
MTPCCQQYLPLMIQNRTSASVFPSYGHGRTAVATLSTDRVTQSNQTTSCLPLPLPSHSAHNAKIALSLLSGHILKYKPHTVVAGAQSSHEGPTGLLPGAMLPEQEEGTHIHITGKIYTVRLQKAQKFIRALFHVISSLTATVLRHALCLQHLLCSICLCTHVLATECDQPKSSPNFRDLFGHHMGAHK